MNPSNPAIWFGLAMVFYLGAVGLILTWPNGTDQTARRPWFYRGRRRAPGRFRRWRQRRAEGPVVGRIPHVGATEAYADHLHALAAVPAPPELALRGFTPPTGLPTVPVIDRMFDDQEALFEADTRRTFDRVYEPTMHQAAIEFRMAMGRIEANWRHQPAPVMFNRTAARDRGVENEETGAIDVAALLAQLDAEAVSVR